MNRKEFHALVQQALDSLPEKYRRLLDNVAVLVEDFPLAQGPPGSLADDEDLLMGEFIGVPRTGRTLWDMPPEPARVVLYQKNIEAYAADCAADALAESADDDPARPERTRRARPASPERQRREQRERAAPALDDIIREEVRLTLLHELGHFFGLDEDALEDV